MTGPGGDDAQNDPQDDRTVAVPNSDQTELPGIPGRREPTTETEEKTTVQPPDESEATVVLNGGPEASTNADGTVVLDSTGSGDDQADQTAFLDERSEAATNVDGTVVLDSTVSRDDQADQTAFLDERSEASTNADGTVVLDSTDSGDDRDDQTAVLDPGAIQADDPGADMTAVIDPVPHQASDDDPELTVPATPPVSVGDDTSVPTSIVEPSADSTSVDATIAMQAASGVLGPDDGHNDATVDWDGVARDAGADATVLTNRIDPDATNLVASVGDPDATDAAFDPLGGDLTEAAEPPRDGRELRRRGGRTDERPYPSDDEPRYNLIDNFAEGGMGRIWKARDSRLHREVAFKELLPKAISQNSVLERFVLEGQVTGQLEHPGIVPIYDLGWQENGTPYYAMKLVNGVELKDAIRNYHKLPEDHPDRRRTLSKLLRHFVDVCNALAFAHSRGVIHRDLKPQNVMLGEFGETLVMDWGLARIVGAPEDQSIQAVSVDADLDELLREGPQTEDDTIRHGQAVGDPGATILVPASEELVDELEPEMSATRGRTTIQTDARSKETVTQFGTIMGTPLYMPPEQALGDIQRMDNRSDVFALGAILYEILSGKTPIPRGRMMKMIQSILKDPIQPPHEHLASIPKPLEAIAMKALEKEMSDRYQNALLLSRDVQNWLDDEPVSAWPEPWYEQAMRWGRRHRSLVASAAAVCVMAVLSVVAWTGLESSRINGLATDARSKLDDARELRDEGDFESARALVGEALAIVETEPSLSDLQDVLNSQLENIASRAAAVERERLAQLGREVQRRLTEAAPLLDSDDTLDQARRLLLEAVTMVQNESQLANLAAESQQTLAAAELRIRQLEERQAVASTFERFLQNADDARYYATVVTSDDQPGNLRDAQKSAASAFELYGGVSIEEQQLPKDLLEQNALISEDRFRLLQSTAFELFLVLAECEVELARAGPIDQRIAAAEVALQWLNLGGQLPIESQAALLRKARYSDLAGNDVQRDLALLAAENTRPSTAVDFYLVGEEHRRARKYSEALRSYRSALQIEPEYFWALNQMGLTHLLSGNAEAAVAGYTAALSRRPDELICYLTRGIAYAELSQFEDALTDLDRAAELAPNQFAVYLNRGAVHLSAGNDQAALADFDRAGELRPASDGPLINIAEVHRLNKHFEDAEQVLTEAIARSASARSYQLRGLTRLALAKPADARDDFTQAIQLDSSAAAVAEAQKQIGMTWHREDDYQQALVAYNESLAADSEDPHTHRLRGEALLALSRFDDAIDSFGENLQRDDPVPDVLRARAVAFASVGRHREAMDDYTHALRLEESSNMLVRRGWTYLNHGYRLAAEDLTEAIAQNPGDPHAWNGRGFALVLQGNYAAAISDAEKGFQRAQAQAQQEGPSAWSHMFNPATIYAQAIERVLEDPARPEAARKALAGEMAGRAMEILAAALQTAGPDHAASVAAAIRSDPFLQPLRERPEFRAATQRNSPDRGEQQ